MIIYFLRHASAGTGKADPARDAKRPLDKEGIEQCGYMGRALASMETQVDAIISSPLKRATQTAILVANEIGHDERVNFSPALQPGASFEDFRRLLDQHLRQEAILVVGHNPSLSQFLSLSISGGANDKAVDLKKGAVARVEFDGRGPAVLNWCLTPKTVRSIVDSAKTKTNSAESARKAQGDSKSSSRPKTVRK